MNIEALQFVYDPTKAEEDLKLMQSEINQSVANGFVILACPVLDGKIFYQLARQAQPQMIDPKLMEKLSKGKR